MIHKRSFLLAVAVLLPATLARADAIDKKADLQHRIRVACDNDIDLNCKGLDFGAGLTKCLDHNRDILADDCKKALNHYQVFMQRYRRHHPHDQL